MNTMTDVVEYPDADQAPYSPPVWPCWVWSLVPLLAILAYITVLRVGFLADDYVLLDQARYNPGDFATLLPRPGFEFLRPIGTLITWHLGWIWWGYNPLPSHIIGLLVHALASLFLALWVYTLTRRPYIGWMAGALFAVYPLNTEAVGWLASQWDLWAVMFGFLSLWLFTRWWQESARFGLLYWLSALTFGLSLFSKESLLAFLPAYALVAWLVTPQGTRTPWRRFSVAIIPFVLVLVLNLAIRFATVGSLCGYSGAPTDYGNFFWDALLVRIRLLVAPINAAALGMLTVQLVAAVVSIALLVGMVAYGRKIYRLLILIVGIFLCSVLPTLNLYLDPSDLANNRLLYLPTAAYCILVSALLYELWRSLSWRKVTYAFALSLLLVCTLVTWLQLRPWHTATVLADRVNSDLLKIVPPQKRHNGMVWYTLGAPAIYEGAYILALGMGNKRYFTAPDRPATVALPPGGKSGVDLLADQRDAFYISFGYDPQIPAYKVNDGAGISKETAESLPTGSTSDNLQLWDFRQCAPDTLAAWNVSNAITSCENGSGVLIDATTADPNMSGPDLDLRLDNTASDPAPYLVRLRIAALYPDNSDATSPYLSQWFWRGAGQVFREDHSKSLPFRQDGQFYVYTELVATNNIGTTLAALRFDPANGQIPVRIGWIAIDTIK